VLSAEVGHRSVEELRKGAHMIQAPLDLPLRLRAGESKWLCVRVAPHEGAERWLRPVGHGVKVTVVNHGHVLGRLFAGCELAMLVRAGDEERVWMPREWLKEDDCVLLLAQALQEEATLESIQIDER